VTRHKKVVVVALVGASILVFLKRKDDFANMRDRAQWLLVPTLARIAAPLTLHFTGWKDRLYAPTFLTKIDSLYFIVDCWHNRVLYSPTVDAPIATWRLLDDGLAGPHSIASDSVLYVVEDTGRHGLRVYTHLGGTFQCVQTIAGLGRRTHRVAYDAASSAFYALSSDSQQITKLIREADRLRVLYRKPLPFLGTAYTRSFTIADDSMFFVSGSNTITKTRYLDDSYQVLATYYMPLPLQGMNDLFKSGKYYYLTATPKTIIRTTSIQSIGEGHWQNIYGVLGFKGTPYYMAEFDGRIFVPQIFEDSGILSFVEHDGAIEDVRTLFDSGRPTLMDREVRFSLPK